MLQEDGNKGVLPVLMAEAAAMPMTAKLETKAKKRMVMVFGVGELGCVFVCLFVCDVNG